jgi:hypothetical protein
MVHQPKKRRNRVQLPICNSRADLRATVAKWVRSLDPVRASRPIVMTDGRKYSPRDLLAEIDRNSELGTALVKDLLGFRIIRDV